MAQLIIFEVQENEKGAAANAYLHDRLSIAGFHRVSSGNYLGNTLSFKAMKNALEGLLMCNLSLTTSALKYVWIYNLEAGADNADYNMNLCNENDLQTFFAGRTVTCDDPASLAHTVKTLTTWEGEHSGHPETNEERVADGDGDSEEVTFDPNIYASDEEDIHYLFPCEGVETVNPGEVADAIMDHQLDPSFMGAQTHEDATVLKDAEFVSRVEDLLDSSHEVTQQDCNLLAGSMPALKGISSPQNEKLQSTRVYGETNLGSERQSPLVIERKKWAAERKAEQAAKAENKTNWLPPYGVLFVFAMKNDKDATRLQRIEHRVVEANCAKVTSGVYCSKMPFSNDLAEITAALSLTEAFCRDGLNTPYGPDDFAILRVYTPTGSCFTEKAVWAPSDASYFEIDDNQADLPKDAADWALTESGYLRGENDPIIDDEVSASDVQRAAPQPSSKERLMMQQHSCLSQIEKALTCCGPDYKSLQCVNVPEGAESGYAEWFWDASPYAVVFRYAFEDSSPDFAYLLLKSDKLELNGDTGNDVETYTPFNSTPYLVLLSWCITEESPRKYKCVPLSKYTAYSNHYHQAGLQILNGLYKSLAVAVHAKQAEDAIQLVKEDAEFTSSGGLQRLTARMGKLSDSMLTQITKP